VEARRRDRLRTGVQRAIVKEGEAVGKKSYKGGGVRGDRRSWVNGLGDMGRAWSREGFRGSSRKSQARVKNGLSSKEYFLIDTACRWDPRRIFDSEKAK